MTINIEMLNKMCIRDRHSGLMCLDFDHVENIGELKQQLLNHEYFDTELLFVRCV